MKTQNFLLIFFCFWCILKKRFFDFILSARRVWFVAPFSVWSRGRMGRGYRTGIGRTISERFGSGRGTWRQFYNDDDDDDDDAGQWW